jgi:hypothetical protein
MREWSVEVSDTSDIAALVERILRVPSQHREYRQSVEDANRVHGLSEDLVTDLLDAGFPHICLGGNVLMDSLDLANCSFRLKLPSARALALRACAAALRTSTSGLSEPYTLEIEPHCPDRGHRGPCHFRLAPEIVEHFGGRRGNDSFEYRKILHPARGVDLLPEMMRELTFLLTDVEFHLLPRALHADLGFLSANGLADCPLAAEFLVRAAVDRGFTARKAFGVFLATPYAIPHLWLDLWIDREWVAVDPHLLRMLVERGVIDATEWPPYRTLSGATWRLYREDIPLVFHGDRWTAYSLPARRERVNDTRA